MPASSERLHHGATLLVVELREQLRYRCSIFICDSATALPSVLTNPTK